MNNFKKIGMTALAASLVSTSVFAGELGVTGSASINFENHSGAANSEPKTFSMGNQITFTGGGELDNGITVALSMVIDDGDSFDAQSVTISSDAMGTLKFSGEGGASTASSIGTSVGGNMWDNFNGTTGNTPLSGTSVSNSLAGDNSFFYTLPSMGVDGLAVMASFDPQTATTASEIGYGLTYTGVDGLTASYATSAVETYAATTTGDESVWKLSYAMGSFTLAASNSEYNLGAATSNHEVTSYKVSYTVSDALSVSYKTDEVKTAATSSVNGEFEGFSASYTAGGMTVSANMQEGKNIANTASAAVDYYGLGLSFAF